MRVLFGIQPYSWKIPGFEALEKISDAISENGASLMWLYRDQKPKGSGLYLDIQAARPDSNSDVLRGIDLEPWAQCLSARYEMSFAEAREVVQRVAKQFISIFEKDYFDAFFAWNTSDYSMGIGRALAEAHGLPVVSFESGLFRDNFRVDSGYFHDARNNLPNEQDLSAYVESGRGILNYLAANPLQLYGDKGKSRSRLKPVQRRRLRIAFVDSLFSDAGTSVVTAETDDGVARSQLAHIAMKMAQNGSEYEVVVRPHPLLRNSKHYKMKAIRRYMRTKGSLDELTDWADVVVTGPSKSTLQCLLKGKPSFSLEKDFLHGALPVIEKEELLDPALFRARLESFDWPASIERVAAAVGYLVAKRWPSLEAPDSVSSLSLRACMQQLIASLDPTDGSGPEEDASAVWNELRDESENRLIEAGMDLRVRLNGLSSRKELVRVLLNSDRRSLKTRII